MQLEKIEVKEPELNENEVNDLFKKIVLGQEVTEFIKTSRGEFKVKFPRARDIESIGRVLASRLRGIPVSCFDVNSYNLMLWVATLDVLVLDGPDWFKLAKKENELFSWRDIPSAVYIQEVYDLLMTFREKVQKQIESNPKTENNRMVNTGSSNDSNEPGLFDGMSGIA